MEILDHSSFEEEIGDQENVQPAKKRLRTSERSSSSKDYIEKVNKLLKKQLKEEKPIKELIELLLQKEKALEPIQFKDSYERFSVFPISSDWEFRLETLKRFTPFMEIINVEQNITQEFRDITFYLTFDPIFTSHCILTINDETKRLQSFKLKDFTSENLHGLPKIELSNLIDHFFKIFNVQTTGENQSRTSKASLGTTDVTSLNTITNSNIVKGDNNSIFNVTMSDHIIELTLKAGFNISHWFYAMNSYCEMSLKRVSFILKVVLYFVSNFGTAIFKESYLSKLEIFARAFLKSIKHNEVSLNGELKESLESILVHTGIDDLDTYFDIAKPKPTVKQVEMIKFMKVFQDLKRLEFDDKKTLTIDWSLMFNFKSGSITSDYDSLKQKETNIKVFEASSVITASVANSDRSGAALQDLSNVLHGLIERKGTVDGICILVEKVLGLNKSE